MATVAHSVAIANSHRDLLNENLGAVIENPLGHLNEEQLLKDVELFARNKSLDDLLPGLKRAALVAQNIMVYDQVARNARSGDGLPVQLTPDEKAALRNERDTLFSQSMGLYMTVLTVSIAGILQGHVQSSINSATLLFPQAFGLDVNTSYGEWIVGVTNAAPFIFAAVLGCPLVEPINRRIGRRGAILVAALLVFASSLGSAFTNSWGQLFACRIFNGIGMGLKASSTPILASETAVSFWRGSAALCWQLWVAFGIMIGFAINLLLSLASDSVAWRLQLGAPLIPSIILILSIRWCPESPRWHMLHGDPGHYRTAYRLFLRLRNTELQALRDLYLIHKQIELESYTRYIYDTEAGYHDTKNHSILAQIGDSFARFGQLFRSRHNRLRNALVASCTVNLAQQLSGINVLAFYSGTVFSHAGSNEKTALLYSFGFGAVNFVFGLPAIRNIDVLGRRKLLLGTLPFMSISLLAAGLSFFIPKDNPAHIGLIAFFLFIFAALYSPGLGPMPFTIASESFPLSHREIGVATSVAVNLFLAGCLTVFYPRLNSAMGDTGSLGLFAGFNILAASMILLWVPETKQRSLEELDFVFAVPMKKFMRYQIKEVLPWFFKYYILGNHAELRDLYQDNIWQPTGSDEKPEYEKNMHEFRIGDFDMVQRRTSGVHNVQEESDLGPGQADVTRLEYEEGLDPLHIETASISTSVGTHD